MNLRGALSNRNFTAMANIHFVDNDRLLDHSVEQAVIEFGESGKIFTAAEVTSAKDRLRPMCMLFSGKK